MRALISYVCRLEYHGMKTVSYVPDLKQVSTCHIFFILISIILSKTNKTNIAAQYANGDGAPADCYKFHVPCGQRD